MDDPGPSNTNLSALALQSSESPKCRHTREDFFSVSLSVRSTKIVPGIFRNIVIFGRNAIEKFRNLNASEYERIKFEKRLYDFTHKCLTITFQCRKCSHQFKRTYEFHPQREYMSLFLKNNDGKYGPVRSYNSYKKAKMTFDLPTPKIPFNEVEKCFDEMPTKMYSLFKYNCGHWEKNFYIRLVTEKFALAPSIWFDKNNNLSVDSKWIEYRGSSTGRPYRYNSVYYELSKSGDPVNLTYQRQRSTDLTNYFFREISTQFHQFLEDNDNCTLRFRLEEEFDYSGSAGTFLKIIPVLIQDSREILIEVDDAFIYLAYASADPTDKDDDEWYVDEKSINWSGYEQVTEDKNFHLKLGYCSSGDLRVNAVRKK